MADTNLESTPSSLSLHKPHTSCMPNILSDLSVVTLSHATGGELKYSIDGANCLVGKRVLTNAGNFVGSSQITSTASTCRHFHPTPYKLRYLSVMWKYRKGRGTICESREKHGNKGRARFSSVREGACFPTSGTANSGLNACMLVARPMALHPRLCQGLYTILASSTTYR